MYFSPIPRSYAYSQLYLKTEKDKDEIFDFIVKRMNNWRKKADTVNFQFFHTHKNIIRVYWYKYIPNANHHRQLTDITIHADNDFYTRIDTYLRKNHKKLGGVKIKANKNQRWSTYKFETIRIYHDHVRPE